MTGDITLYAKWIEEEEPTEPTPPVTEPEEWENPFADVSEGDWFYEAVKYAEENGLFSGTTANTFAPNEAITRGMLVTVLWRNEGEPEVTGTVTFADVSEDVYYTKAIVWGQQNGIILGHSDEEFAPDDFITREQFAAIMHRYADLKGVAADETDDLARFTDVAEVSD